MIRTVTLSTGFDEVFTVDRVEFGGAANVLSSRVLASGKGVNAARAIAALGGPVTAYALIGKPDRDAFAESLEREGIPARLSTVPGGTRRNLTLLASDRQPAAHFRGPSFVLEDEAPVRELFATVLSEVRPGDLVSLHGATPSGLPATTWARFAVEATLQGASVVADVYGPALGALVERCALLACKPNQEEIKGLPLNDAGEPGSALRYLASHGVQLAAVSLGPDGLTFLSHGVAWNARCPVKTPRMLVGAGDACVAGLAVALHRGAEHSEAARYAVAVASAHVEGCEASDLALRTRALLAAVSIEPCGAPAAMLESRA